MLDLDNKNKNGLLDIQAKSVQIEYMHSLSKTKSTTDRKLSDISLANNITPNNSQDKQKQKLRDDLN